MRSSAIFFVRVVTRTRSPRPIVVLISRDEVVDLALGRLDDDLGIDQAGGPDDLLDHLARDRDLVLGRGRREKDALVDARLELLEAERSIVLGRREAEPVLDQGVLAGPVARELAMELGHGHVALVDHQQAVVGEVVEQGVRRLARRHARRGGGCSSRPRCNCRARPASRGRARCASAAAGPRAACPPAPARGRRSPSSTSMRGDGVAHALVAGDVVGGGEDDQLLEVAEQLAGQDVETAQIRSTSSPNSSMRTAYSS